jgi:UDP-3-O-[3-hydroxymyristoyl] glucosamine N-acyltransferase
MAKLEMTLSEVAELLGNAEIHGDPGFFCASVASLDGAGPDQLSFVKDRRYDERARASDAGALLVDEPIEAASAHQVVVEAPFAAFGRLLHRIAVEKRRQPTGLHPAATVDPSARLGRNVTIGAGAVIREEAEIGDRATIYANAYVGQRSRVGADSVLHPNVVVMEDVFIGERVVIHGGTVLGADGYGYIQHEGRHIKVPQVGEIRIGDDVEIGALTTIDRATLETTRIGRGTKIGDLVHIAHNCRVGEDALILPAVAISGSVTIGDRAVLAGRAGTADNLTVGEGAVLGGTSVAFKDVEPGEQMWGNPARPKLQEMRIQSTLRHLPEMRRDLRTVKRKLGLR